MAFAGAGAIALGAGFRLPVPGFALSFTLQTFAILALGLLYGAPRAAVAAGLYLALAAASLPVLSGWQSASGAALWTLPSFGFLLCFPLAPFAQAAIAGPRASGLRVSLAAFAAHLLILAVGCAVLAAHRTDGLGDGLDFASDLAAQLLPGAALKSLVLGGLVTAFRLGARLR